jgi:hypothetical protein
MEEAMITGVLVLMLALMALLLAVFIYQIVTRPVPAVDAPTLIRSAAAPPASAPALPVGQPRVPASHAATRPAPGASPPGASGGPRSWAAAALTIAGLAAVIMCGWLFLHIAPGAAACSHLVIEVCSQGFVLFTGTQLAGAAVAVAGLGVVIIAIVLALRS